jgi:hypothetical protein
LSKLPDRDRWYVLAVMTVVYALSIAGAPAPNRCNVDQAAKRTADSMFWQPHEWAATHDA